MWTQHAVSMVQPTGGPYSLVGHEADTEETPASGYYIAMAECGIAPRKRARVPADIRNRYQLIRLADHNSAYAVEIGPAPVEHAPLPSVRLRGRSFSGKLSRFNRLSKMDRSCSNCPR